MLLTERLKEIMDIQTIILLHLDKIKSRANGRETDDIPSVARIYSIDQATVRRNFKGDGKRQPYEKSLLGKGLVIEVKKGRITEYMITEKGLVEVSERKLVIKKIIG